MKIQGKQAHLDIKLLVHQQFNFFFKPWKVVWLCVKMTMIVKPLELKLKV